MMVNLKIHHCATLRLLALIDKEDLEAQALTDRKIDALIAFMKILTDKRYESLIEK